MLREKNKQNFTKFVQEHLDYLEKQQDKPNKTSLWMYVSLYVWNQLITIFTLHHTTVMANYSYWKCITVSDWVWDTHVPTRGDSSWTLATLNMPQNERRQPERVVPLQVQADNNHQLV